MKKNKIKDMLLIVGGIIPRADIPILKKSGVDEIFLPGGQLNNVVQYINDHVPVDFESF